MLAGGVESMSRVPMGSDGGAWAMDPETNFDDRLRAAGHRRRPDRHHRGLQPRGRRRVRRCESQARAAKAWSNGYFARSRRAGARPQRARRARPRRAHPPGHHGGGAGRAARLVRRASATSAASTRSRCRSTTGSSGSTTCTPPATRPASSTAPSLVLDRQRARRRRGRPHARAPASSPPRVSGADPTIMLTGPAPATPQGAGEGRPDRRGHRPGRDQRGVRRRRAALRRDLGFDPDIVNVNGGAIAMGHPLGATGAHDPRHAARRAGAPGPAVRPGHAVRRRRHGHRDDHRAGLMGDMT